MRQLIIARKDLHMSAGKLAAQVSHASMAFLTNMIWENAKPVWKYETLLSYQISRTTGEKEHRLYKHPELCAFSLQAFQEGRDSFTVRRGDDGKFELCENEIVAYSSKLTVNKDIYEQWIDGIFTKTICEAKNKNQLMKAVTLAEEQGLREGVDFFLIRDACLTELEPEENGTTLTCIGFRPLPDDIAHAISRKYQLYV